VGPLIVNVGEGPVVNVGGWPLVDEVRGVAGRWCGPSSTWVGDPSSTMWVGDPSLTTWGTGPSSSSSTRVTMWGCVDDVALVDVSSTRLSPPLGLACALVLVLALAAVVLVV
jgi:hypothetical protein